MNLSLLWGFLPIIADMENIIKHLNIQRSQGIGRGGFSCLLLSLERRFYAHK
jgi:hypothetical protein